MTEIVVAREVAAPTSPNSRHFDAPRWWPEWIVQVLGAQASAATAPSARPPVAPAATPESAYAAAVLALRTASREAREAAASGDDWSAVVAQHRVHLARRSVRALLDAAAASGPGSRLEWCVCGYDSASA